MCESSIIKAMKLLIAFENRTSDEFAEDQLDMSKLTMRGHAANLIERLKTQPEGFYPIDNYNAILLEKIISVRITK